MRIKLYNFWARYLPLKWASHWVFKWILKTNITTTNPGVVPFSKDLESWGEAQVQDFVNFPQIAPPSRLGVIYTTFRKRLRIVILHDQALLSQKQAEQLSQILWEEIQRIIKNPMS